MNMSKQVLVVVLAFTTVASVFSLPVTAAEDAATPSVADSCATLKDAELDACQLKAGVAAENCSAVKNSEPKKECESQIAAKAKDAQDKRIEKAVSENKCKGLPAAEEVKACDEIVKKKLAGDGKPKLPEFDFDWGSLGFGVGLGLTALGEADVKEAVVADKKVRITEESKYGKAVWLETHYHWQRWGADADGYKRHAWGPFVGVSISGDGNILNSLGGGFMYSGSRGKDSNMAFNVGLGAASTKIQILGGGLKEGEVLPGAEESVRYRKKDDVKLLLLFGFDFVSGKGTKEGASNQFDAAKAQYQNDVDAQR